MVSTNSFAQTAGSLTGWHAAPADASADNSSERFGALRRMLVSAGAVDHVEEGLTVQVAPEVLGEEPPEGAGQIGVTAG
jgi:hypothetical protein